MLTKETENVLEALPAFITMVGNLHNPLQSDSLADGYEPTSLETVSKAVWFIVPFHFVAFIGLAPSGSDLLILVLLGLGTLLVLMYSGTVLGAVTNWVFGGSKTQREATVSNWVVSLFTVWFFCVFALSALTVVVLLFDRNQGAPISSNMSRFQWPNVVTFVDNWLLSFENAALRKKGLVVVCFVASVISVFCLNFLALRSGTRGSRMRALALAVICFFVCVALIWSTSSLLEPTLTTGITPTELSSETYG